MGRDTGGVRGMDFRAGDELLSMDVIKAGDTEGSYVFTVTDGGFAKRSKVADYRVQGRNGLGTKAASIPEDRGVLVGALIVGDEDEVMCIRASGSVTRSRVAEVNVTGRVTMGVRFVRLDEGDAVVAVARNEPDEPEVAAEDAPVEQTEDNAAVEQTEDEQA
jgi:DNA gyrase subunit A